MSNVIFKSVCFLTIFVLVFVGVAGGILTGINYSGAQMCAINWYYPVEIHICIGGAMSTAIAELLTLATNVVNITAKWTGADWLAQLADMAATIGNIVQSFQDDSAAQGAADKIMREVLRLALNEFHRLLIAFINSKGDPKVIQDFHKEFAKLAEGAAGEFLNALAGTNLCNKDWGTRIKLLLPAAPAPLASRFKCSLSDIAKQMQATAGVSVSVENVGFDEFARMFEPQNNLLGYLLMTGAEVGAARNQAAEVGQLETKIGGGQKAVRDAKGNIITPGFLVADLTKEGATKDYDLWARQLAAVTPYRCAETTSETSSATTGEGGQAEGGGEVSQTGNTKCVLGAVNFVLETASAMAAMVVKNGLVNISESDLADDKIAYQNFTVDSSKANQASNDVQDAKTISENLRKIGDELNKTKDKIAEILPIIQQIVDKEKTLPSLLVSKMNESSGAVCGFNSFSNYLSVSKTLVSSSTQTPDANTMIITEKYEISVSEAASGEKYVEKAEITKTTTQTQTLNQYQQPETTTTATYSLNSQSIVAGHQADLNKYLAYQANYQNIQNQIKQTTAYLAELQTAAANYSNANCAVSSVNGQARPQSRQCQELETAYDAAKTKAVKFVQSVIFSLSGKYTYATAGGGADLDANENGIIEAPEKNLETNLDNLDAEVSYLYDDLYKLYQELQNNADGAQYQNQYTSACQASKGFYKTKYCLNDAYSGASGIVCSR